MLCSVEFIVTLFALFNGLSINAYDEHFVV